MLSLPRYVVIAALIGLVMAILGAVFAGGARTRQLAVEDVAVDALDELALLAGLRDDSGNLMRPDPMAVEVIQDGGPLWVQGAVEAAVDENLYFTRGNSPHLLRAEVIDVSGGAALQLHLWRAGWDLRVPEPRRVRIGPWAAIVGAILGAFAAFFSRRLSWGLVTAGILSQLLLGLAPLPADLFPPRPLLKTWSEGPLVRRTLQTVDNLSSMEIAIVAAILAACLVLVAFDHRRSREKSEGNLDLGSAGLAALLGTIGVVAWIEAASRGALLMALHPRGDWYAGWGALIGLGLLYWPVVLAAREGWRARS